MRRIFLLLDTLICVVAASETYLSEDGNVIEDEAREDIIEIDDPDDFGGIWNRFLHSIGYAHLHRTCRNGMWCTQKSQCTG